MADQDRHLDAHLRDVPVPTDLGRRVAADAVFSDSAIDRWLADVGLPTGLVDRILATASGPPAAGRNEGAVDLERIASATPRVGDVAGWRRPSFGRWATAIARDGLAVATALSVAWILFAVGAELSRQLAAAPRAEFTRMAPEQGTRGRAGGGDDPFTNPRHIAGEAGGDVNGRPMTGPEPDGSAGDDAAEMPGVPVMPVIPAPATTVATAAVAGSSGSPQPLEVRGAAVGLTGEPANDPGPLWLPEPPRDAWRTVPRVRGFDLAFEMAHGEPPFVDPAVAGLSTDVPPLSLRTDAFDRLTLRDGRSWRGAGRDLRMEHVLAAVPATGDATRRRPSPGSDIRVDIHGVRSLRSVRGEQSLIVEVAATAERDGGSAGGPPLDATVVMDRSVGGDPLVWPWFCRGLAAVAGEMNASDRLTVIVAGPVPRLAMRRGNAATIAALAAELQRLPPTDVSDIDAALRMAAAESPSAGSRLVVVTHQETADHGRDEVRAAVASWREAQAGGRAALPDDGPPGRGLSRFVLVDPTTSAEARSPGPSFGRTPADATAIRREVVRQVFATETLVGRQCRLAVSFDPRRVAAYRLIGHRQSAMESLAVAAPGAIDLHVGETVRAVYEVVPRDAAAAAGVSAVLDWRTADDTVRRSRGSAAATDVDLSATLPSAHGCELLLAVTVAEMVGGSAHLDARATTAAAALVRRWRERGDMTAFGSLLAGGIEAVPTGRRPQR